MKLDGKFHLFSGSWYEIRNLNVTLKDWYCQRKQPILMQDISEMEESIETFIVYYIYDITVPLKSVEISLLGYSILLCSLTAC